jgi:hypothetical protein
MEDQVDGFRLGLSSLAILSRISLGSLHLRLSSHGSIPKSLDLSLSVFQKRERKNKKERSERENEENKRIKKI